MSVSARGRLLAYLQQSGLSTARAEANLDAFAHELAEQQRTWALDYDGAQDSSYDYTYAVTLGAKLAADLIDPCAGPVHPDEEPT
ncbi:hypothetical protein [Streptomyces sp. NPDC086519]|uniref:hypothetical protein n=1 Tax=Streptomyces sp. NPDC086519 TaxID=3154863 RepID=UPI0034284007